MYNPNYGYNQQRLYLMRKVTLPLFKWTYLWQCGDQQKANLHILEHVCKLHMVDCFLDLRLYFSWVVTSAVGTGNFLQFYWAELQDFCSFEAMRKSEHEYQVALPAVTIILIYFKRLNIKIKHLSLDMSITQVWITFSFYLNPSNTWAKKKQKNTEASTLCTTSLNKLKDRKKSFSVFTL